MLGKSLLLGAVLALSVGSISEAHAERGWDRGGHHGGHHGGRSHWGGHHGGRSHWGGHHGGHSGIHLGFAFGDPFFWGSRPYYRDYAPAYYAPPTVIIEREPPVYVQRSEPPPTQVTQLWYYCPSPAGYYPHVPSCSQAWVPVDPRTVPPSR
jgi:hypothetical protein